MRILILNAQKGYNPALWTFLERTIKSDVYDLFLLQEVPKSLLEKLPALSPNYLLLKAFNNDVGRDSMLCILYRASIPLLAAEFLSLTNHHPRIKGRAEFGVLAGTFEVGGKKIVIGSLHLHAGFRFDVRKNEVRLVKQWLLNYADGLPIIFGGDFNSGWPWEAPTTRKLLAPEFICVTRNLGPTLDSRYTEPNPNIINTAAVFLGHLGINVPMHTDHVYISRDVDPNMMTTRLLPDRVSDHSPVEFVLA